jgi:medium-chain acyl-[acyl-carrier-protein] hydrolase
MSPVNPTPWLRLFERPSAQMRLICFPYAGGGGSVFAPWAKAAPGWLEIGAALLPGRENRYREPPVRRLMDLIPPLAEGLAPALEGRYAFYGHSLGALIAFELARHLRDRGGRGPEALLLGGCSAPHRALRRGSTSSLPDAQFIAELHRMNGTPREVLANGELLRLVLPMLRADLAMLESYAYAFGQPLPVRLFAYGGREDRLVSEPDLQAWSIYSTGPFKVTVLPGDHFFISTAPAPFFQALWSDLEAVAGRPR